MVRVEQVGLLSEDREQRSYRSFPEADLRELRAAVASVPPDVFDPDAAGTEIRRFDALVADDLPTYEHEHGAGPGRNPACKLWASQGFDHSVDLYHPEKRIAVEIEKSERKRVSDDVLKFIKGGKTQRDNRKQIEYGCLVVPTNYRGSGDLFRESMNTLAFVRSVLFVEDVAVIGYADPRWS